MRVEAAVLAVRVAVELGGLTVAVLAVAVPVVVRLLRFARRYGPAESGALVAALAP